MLKPKTPPTLLMEPCIVPWHLAGLEQFLIELKIAPEKFGQGNAIALDKFCRELETGETNFSVQEGKLHRVVEHVHLRLQLDDKVVCLTSDDGSDSGEAKSLGFGKKRSTESYPEAAGRLAFYNWGFDPQWLDMDNSVAIAEEEAADSTNEEAYASAGLSSQIRHVLLPMTIKPDFVNKVKEHTQFESGSFQNTPKGKAALAWKWVKQADVPEKVRFWQNTDTTGQVTSLKLEVPKCTMENVLRFLMERGLREAEFWTLESLENLCNLLMARHAAIRSTATGFYVEFFLSEFAVEDDTSTRIFVNTTEHCLPKFFRTPHETQASIPQKILQDLKMVCEGHTGRVVPRADQLYPKLRATEIQGVAAWPGLMLRYNLQTWLCRIER